MKKQEKKYRDIFAVQLLAKQWFDRVNGNTYHSVSIDIIYKDKTQESIKSGFTYGYGSQWDQTALDLFVERFKIKIPCYHESTVKKYSYLSSLCKDRKIPIQIHVLENCKKRDL